MTQSESLTAIQAKFENINKYAKGFSIFFIPPMAPEPFFTTLETTRQNLSQVSGNVIPANIIDNVSQLAKSLTPEDPRHVTSYAKIELLNLYKDMAEHNFHEINYGQKSRANPPAIKTRGDLPPVPDNDEGPQSWQAPGAGK